MSGGLLFDGDRATGVEVRMRAPFSDPGVIADPNKLAIPVGETFTVRAKNVVLSAGALGLRGDLVAIRFA